MHQGWYKGKYPQENDESKKDDPKMFDIPLVTSTSHIVLQKLVDSEKFKDSIPKVLLQQYKEATLTSGSNVGALSGERQLEDPTRNHWSQQQTCRPTCRYSVVHKDRYC